jgi:allantoinase
MPLDPSYLEYPKRRLGMDHDLYGWSNLHARAPITWPGGKRVAVMILVSAEFFPLTPNDKPFPAPGHMQTPYPDYRHFTARDYGTRVGLYRFLDAFSQRGISASVALSSALCVRAPSIVRDILAGGHELLGHGRTMNDSIATGLAEAEERAIIRESVDQLEQFSGSKVRGWHSIARSQSWNTPRLLAEAGLAYCTDWVNDDLPYVLSTPSGPLINIPVNHELSDRQILTVQQQSADSYAEQMQDAYAWLAGEGAGRLLTLHITPYILGLPYRIDAFERLLDWLATQEQTWFASGGMVLDHWRKETA